MQFYVAMKMDCVGESVKQLELSKSVNGCNHFGDYWF